MEGNSNNFGGVTLVNGTTHIIADSVTLVSGGRVWKLRVPSVQESVENVMLLEVKQGNRWYPAQEFVVTDDSRFDFDLN